MNKKVILIFTLTLLALIYLYLSSFGPLAQNRIANTQNPVSLKPVQQKTYNIFHNKDLKENYYDRILLLNVYHELTKKQPILSDIWKSLKSNGVLVIMERMAHRKGKMHGDCNHLMLYEPDFLKELNGLHFELANKNEQGNITYYIFKK